ncbi:unnamed protein product [Didymodactylos carnosus]|uniref:Glycosyl hydrolase family 13 catalytic domain-containing protein n=1 Tax=Didymodactylos carnosus TaxID=1234261 RepID=A0A815S8I7_9BILA|nr:unnamed protein product [Didymodactylos carnosus]CAF1486834.1 unnamed protein product [Didymodactylos carnosus]CAF4223982.1 unnamed protein product [Didymodactylos carnosus]CAF4350717.1 unnamed protein product [Didymodactylos carnosus]
MIRLFGNGAFDDIMNELPNFHSLGINAIWISLVHQQVQVPADEFGENNHGYWPKSRISIDKNLGSKESFCLLIQKARDFNIKICVDIILNHFGYDNIFLIDDQYIHITNSEYFRQQSEISSVTTQSECELLKKNRL